MGTFRCYLQQILLMGLSFPHLFLPVRLFPCWQCLLSYRKAQTANTFPGSLPARMWTCDPILTNRTSGSVWVIWERISSLIRSGVRKDAPSFWLDAVVSSCDTWNCVCHLWPRWLKDEADILRGKDGKSSDPQSHGRVSGPILDLTCLLSYLYVRPIIVIVFCWVFCSFRSEPFCSNIEYPLLPQLPQLLLNPQKWKNKRVSVKLLNIGGPWFYIIMITENVSSSLPCGHRLFLWPFT